MRDHQRLSVLINDDCAKILRRVTDERDISVTEAVRRGIGLLGFMEECLRKGHRVSVDHPEA